MQKIVATMIAVSMLAAPTVVFAKSHSSRNYSKPYEHKAKKPRGETCWRTNRHTGQRFRTC
ncbi:hypothetical protein ACQUJT_11875 [Ralstonia pseudosolanacearum]